MTFLDVVVFPYTLAYSMMLSEPWPLAAKWLATWITGFSIVVGALVCVHLSVFFTCEKIDAAIAAVRVAADRGATLHQRRRHAHWVVRIEKWLRIVKRSTWIRRGFPEERPSIERLSNVSIRASFPRSFIGVTFAVGTLAKAAKRTVLSWFGAFSIVATTWVVYQAQVRQGAADIAASLHALSIPVAIVALIFTVSTFFAVNAVHWRRRGLSKWRADHLAAGYADLERIRAIMANLSLDKLLAGGDDERHYREYLETAIRDGCQTEAELVECLTALDKVLFPHSLWERLRAALNR